MDFGRTRDFSEFCEQLSELRLKFQKWDSCEKTVALYYLMVGLPFANARFLQNALDQLVRTINTPETQIIEDNANNPDIIRSFITENPQASLCLLLNHLPLLRPGNRETAQFYLNTIRRILTDFITPPFKRIYNECVEIMSYVYIHPAFDKEDKRSFKHFLKQVLNKVSPDNFIHSPVDDSGDKCISPNLEFYQANKKRSNSLTPTPVYLYDVDCWSSQENLTQPPSKPRSYSLSCDKNIVESTHIHSSSSETKLQEMVIRNNMPLMKSILSWLKSLRLHKYSWIFHNLTSNQMLNLTEEYLLEVGVTKGARHKILLSLQKLRERGRLLSELEVAVMNGCDINDALKELKGILQSPLQISLGEDLCSQFVKVMGKVCTQLLTSRQSTDEKIMMFNSLCEKAENIESFTVEQKRKLIMWKEQLIVGDVLASNSQRLCIHKSVRSNQMINPSDIHEIRAESPNRQKSSSYPNVQGSSHLATHRHSVDSITLKNQLLYINSLTTPEPSSNEDSGCSNLKRKLDSQTSKNNFDIETSLESLCIQMMEHALGP